MEKSYNSLTKILNTSRIKYVLKKPSSDGVPFLRAVVRPYGLT